MMFWVIMAVVLVNRQISLLLSQVRSRFSSSFLSFVFATVFVDGWARHFWAAKKDRSIKQGRKSQLRMYDDVLCKIQVLCVMNCDNNRVTVPVRKKQNRMILYHK